MARSFAKYPAKPTFAEFKEPLDASEYTRIKKATYTFCAPNVCHPNKNMNSQGQYLLNKYSNYLAFYPCINEIDKTQLYINLITKLDLTGTDIPVISYLNGGTYPVIINPLAIPYLSYNIDPSGKLFGNTPCGITNFEDYIFYNKQTDLPN